MIPVPSIVVYKGSRSQDRPESPTVVVRGGMPSLPSSRQGLAISGGSGGGALHQDALQSDMIDGNANVGTSSATNTFHRSPPSCPPPDKSDTESKNFRNRVRVLLIAARSLPHILLVLPHYWPQGTSGRIIKLKISSEELWVGKGKIWNCINDLFFYFIFFF